MSPDRLDLQVRHLLDRGYAPATFTRAVLDPPARRTVAITFDDAFRSVRDLALPVLRRLGVPATVFVPTARVGREGPISWPGLEPWVEGDDARELEGLRRPELRALADAGWEIGSHSRTQPRLSGRGGGSAENARAAANDPPAAVALTLASWPTSTAPSVFAGTRPTRPRKQVTRRGALRSRRPSAPRRHPR